jgi:hypothetical protein
VKAPAKQIAPQTAWDMQSNAEQVDEKEGVYLWRAALWSAMRTFAKAYISDEGQKGYAAVAAELDKIWGPDEIGRPVSESTLSAALRDSERNYFRLEWIEWFRRHSPEIHALLAGETKPIKTAAEELEDLKNEIRETYPKHADSVIRRARVR